MWSVLLIRSPHARTAVTLPARRPADHLKRNGNRGASAEKGDELKLGIVFADKANARIEPLTTVDCFHDDDDDATPALSDVNARIASPDSVEYSNYDDAAPLLF